MKAQMLISNGVIFIDMCSPLIKQHLMFMYMYYGVIKIRWHYTYIMVNGPNNKNLFHMTVMNEY